ncbi:MAG: hypothetical protein ACUVQ8_06765 [Nitrososphaeria archaeon]
MHDIASQRTEWHEKVYKFPFTLFDYYNPNITYVSISRHRAQQLAQILHRPESDKILVIPNGVKAEDFLKFDKFTKDLMNKLTIGYNDLVILIPVRVTPRKNIEFALAIANELKYLIGEQ